MNKTDMSAIWFSKIISLNCMISITPLSQVKRHAELQKKKHLCESAMVNCIRGREDVK